VKLVSEKSIEFRLTSPIVSARGGAVGTSSSSSETVSTTGAVALLLLAPSVAIGSGGTEGEPGGMISGGTIEGLEQIELIARPNENPEQESCRQGVPNHYH